MEHSLWTEKYRPETFEEVKGQKEIVKRIKAFVEQKNMPHVLFAGPAGVGKTTLALVIVKQLYKESWHENFLELNASDERGIDVIRIKVKEFARTKSIGEVPFKIIYLDECDALTKEAQQALRRTMENYSQTCRFILSCNYSSKIIEPIQSRCAVFRFKPLSKEELFEIINNIASREKLSIDNSGKEALVEVSEGDVRKLENIMQACAILSNKINEAVVFEVAGFARPKEISQILDYVLKKDFDKAKTKLLDTMLNYGMSGIDIIKQLHKEVWNLSISAEKRLEMMKECAEIEFRMVEGSDEFLQLEALIARLILIVSK
ncbi:MAG: ATPase AAA [Candidatus Woesearchaeota archaeon]|nr:MAG: ATPase AAA [Candidatus Woesearchaeota archaeon]